MPVREQAIPLLLEACLSCSERSEEYVHRTSTILASTYVNAGEPHAVLGRFGGTRKFKLETARSWRGLNDL